MRLNRRGLGTGHSRSRIGLSVGLLLVMAAIAFGLASGAWLARVSAGTAAAHPPVFAAASSTSAASVPQIRAAFDHLPLIFEPNQGQSDARVQFLARGNGYGLFLTRDEAVLALRTAWHCNGVSALHGEVSRKMWARVWPEVPKPEIPITSPISRLIARPSSLSTLARAFSAATQGR